jgi:hypothetical protein
MKIFAATILFTLVNLHFTSAQDTYAPGAYFIRLFVFVTETGTTPAPGFVPRKYFHASLIFASEARKQCNGAT